MAKKKKKKKGKKKRVYGPLKNCLINKERENGLAHISIIRKMSPKTYIIGAYLVDLYCLGLKDTFAHQNLVKQQVDMYLRKSYYNELEEIPIELARQIVYGGIDYAKELGFSPHKDFRMTKSILGERVPEEETYDVEFGYKGKPYYISGPYDDVDSILETLNIVQGGREKDE